MLSIIACFRSEAIRPRTLVSSYSRFIKAYTNVPVVLTLARTARGSLGSPTHDSSYSMDGHITNYVLSTALGDMMRVSCACTVM